MTATKNNAFTLIEILIAITIVVTMGAIIGMGYVRYVTKSNIVATKQTMKNVEAALVIYYGDMGRFPETGNLDALVVEPTPKGRWNGPYIENVPLDSWSNEFEYNAYKDIKNKDKGFKKYELISYGEGGIEGGEGEEEEIIVGK